MKVKEILTPFRNILLSLAILSVVLSIAGITVVQQVTAQDTKIYDNPQLGLKFPYPSDWVLQPETPRQNSDGSTVYGLVFNANNDVGPDITVQAISPVTDSLEDAATSSLQNMVSEFGMQYLGQGPLSIGDKNAYGYSALSGQVENLNILIDTDNTRYRFTLGEEDPSYSELLPIFQRIIASAELTGVAKNLQGESQGFNPFN